MGRTHDRNMTLLQTKQANGYELTTSEKKQLEKWQKNKLKIN
tara:strand:- start:306 stop:431 length:126 start_codon:yes stop_codon:yes gene_type:complete